ncbi:DUF305 domain-containing protein [Cnuibacter physcomitrellae]|nr:DUF305 domain-containing protein [Cnuibacter physcomitrellae]
MLTGVLAAAITLAGCSSGSGSMSGMDHGSGSSTMMSSGSSESATFNDQDVMFAQMMTAHHQQAIEMSDTLLSKSGVDEKVTQLAEKIKAAQQPEIDTMTGWLESWGASTDGMMMDHGSDGMMSADDMTALEQADGAAAGKLFLERMIQHHQGAIEMAQTEVDSGENADAVALAKKIITDQTAEIAQMQIMLASA